MDQPVADASQLEYAPAIPMRRRRRIRRAILLIMMIATGVILWRLSPAFIRQVRYVYWQSKCMNAPGPPKGIAYEEEGVSAAALLLLPDYRRAIIPATATGTAAMATVTPVGFIPPPLLKLRAASDPIVFMHGRKSPAGDRRLVLVGVLLEGQSGFGRKAVSSRIVQLDASAKTTATMIAGQQIRGTKRLRLCLILTPEDRLRLLWGQADPEQGDHFTIGYILNGQPGTIDGYLKDGENVVLTVRDGPAKKAAAMLPW